jgi:hypothetical protein
MNASEARELARESAATKTIGPWVERVHDLIRAQCLKGKTLLPNLEAAFSGLRGPTPDSAEWTQIIRQLGAEGYRVVFHPNQDIRDPREMDYHSVHWD